MTHSGFVYFAYDAIFNAVKIGCTSGKVGDRLKAQPGLHHLYHIPVFGNLKRTEARVQFTFSGSHMFGERFFPDRSCISLLNEIKCCSSLNSVVKTESEFLAGCGWTDVFRPKGNPPDWSDHPNRQYVYAAHIGVSDPYKTDPICPSTGERCNIWDCHQKPSLLWLLNKYPLRLGNEAARLKFRKRFGCRQFVGIEILSNLDENIVLDALI